MAMLAMIPTGLELSAQDSASMPAFELQDQFGRLHLSTDWAGVPVVLIGSDRAGRYQSQEWAVAVTELVAKERDFSLQVKVLRVADLRGVPGFLKGKVTKQIRRTLETSLLLDWEGQVVSHYGFQSALANVVLMNRNGSVVTVIRSTQLHPDEMNELKNALLSLEAAAPERVEPWNRTVLLGSCL